MGLQGPLHGQLESVTVTGSRVARARACVGTGLAAQVGTGYHSDGRQWQSWPKSAGFTPVALSLLPASAFTGTRVGNTRWVHLSTRCSLNVHLLLESVAKMRQEAGAWWHPPCAPASSEVSVCVSFTAEDTHDESGGGTSLWSSIPGSWPHLPACFQASQGRDERCLLSGYQLRGLLLYPLHQSRGWRLREIQGLAAGMDVKVLESCAADCGLSPEHGGLKIVMGTCPDPGGQPNTFPE